MTFEFDPTLTKYIFSHPTHSFSQPLSWWNRPQKIRVGISLAESKKNPYYTFYKYKSLVWHVYFGPHLYCIDNLTDDFEKHHFYQIFMSWPLIQSKDDFRGKI